MSYQTVFKRYEKKYLLTAQQYKSLLQAIGDRLVRDQYAESTISNLYFDTPDFRLIRTSLLKPAYKEKLRLRCYRTPGADSEAFVEIKKKVGGVVYKRRVGMTYRQAVDYLCRGKDAPQDTQITREVNYLCRFYDRLQPTMMIAYDRLALHDREVEELRITFDRNIRWRTDRLDLQSGADGEPLLAPDTCLMEIKIPNAMPLWLCHALADAGIFTVSYSKYGAAYETMLRRKQQKKEASVCA